MKRNRIRLALAGVAVMMVTTAVAASNALASSNGQQVQVQADTPFVWVRVCGTNQNNHRVCTPVKTGPVGGYGGFVDVRFPGWWFKGWVGLSYWTVPHGAPNGQSLCYVPRFQAGSSWTGCTVP
jgi:hypothetical protein